MMFIVHLISHVAHAGPPSPTKKKFGKDEIETSDDMGPSV